MPSRPVPSHFVLARSFANRFAEIPRSAGYGNREVYDHGRFQRRIEDGVEQAASLASSGFDGAGSLEVPVRSLRRRKCREYTLSPYPPRRRHRPHHAGNRRSSLLSACMPGLPSTRRWRPACRFVVLPQYFLAGFRRVKPKFSAVILRTEYHGCSRPVMGGPYPPIGMTPAPF